MKPSERITELFNSGGDGFDENGKHWWSCRLLKNILKSSSIRRTEYAIIKYLDEQAKETKHT